MEGIAKHGLMEVPLTFIMNYIPDDTVTIYVTGLAVCCGYGGCGRIAHSDMICQYMMD
jgi:hypothetical protein